MKYWSPSKSQVLDCMHEENNPYYFFAIKTCEKLTGRTAGHLPMEMSYHGSQSIARRLQAVSPSARRIRDTVQFNHKNAINLDK